MSSNKTIFYKLKELLKIIGKIILLPFEHLAEIFIVAVVLAFITLLQLSIFDIPKRYGDKIWLSNIILSFIIYYIAKKLNSKD